MNWFKELKERWKAETPVFWKKVMSISITLGSSAVAILGAEKLFDLQNYGVPQIIFTVAGYVVVAAAACGLSAKITKQDGFDDMHPRHDRRSPDFKNREHDA